MHKGDELYTKYWTLKREIYQKEFTCHALSSEERCASFINQAGDEYFELTRQVAAAFHRASPCVADLLKSEHLKLITE